MTSSRYVLAKSWPQLGLRPGSASSSISDLRPCWSGGMSPSSGYWSCTSGDHCLWHDQGALVRGKEITQITWVQSPSRNNKVLALL